MAKDDDAALERAQKAEKSCLKCTHLYQGTYCKRFPPQVVGPAPVQSVWPRVFIDEFCGEFKKV